MLRHQLYISSSKLIKALSFGILYFSSLVMGYAQCATCKAAAATKDEAGDLVIGAGLNTGILYLLALPFLAVAFIGFVWYRKKRQLDQAQES